MCDLIEHLDYEDFLLQHYNIICRDSLRNILDFPVNDVQIKEIERKIRTLHHVVPNEELSELPLHVQHCVDCYTRPWKVVEFSQRMYSSSCASRERLDRGAISPSVYHQEFEIDRDNSISFDDTLTYGVKTFSIHNVLNINDKFIFL